MTKLQEFQSAAIPERERGHLPGRAKSVLCAARSRLRRAAGTARAILATVGPLGAALWALYPVAIALLVIGFLFAGTGSI